MSKTTIIRDSTQIQAFFDCPQLWKLAHDEQLTMSMGPPEDAMKMGTYLHKMLELYYKGRANGYGVSACMDIALSFNPDMETCKCGHAYNYHMHETKMCAKCLGNGKEMHEFVGQPFPLDKEKRELVRERFRVYIYTYSADDFIPRSPEHVEVGFSYKLFEDAEKLYILEGRYDILADHRGLATWVDHKGQLSAYDLYNKSIQFRNYDLVTEAVMACINYIRLTKKVDTTTYVRQWVSFSKPEREFWKRRLIKIYDKMLHFERNGITPDDYTWGSCSGKFKRKCIFTPLCEESYIPDVVAQKKRILYHIKDEWKPW